jgi:protocatechuate 3,4-dioxygenase beta subunit
MTSDIREGSAGLPLVLVLTVVNVNNTCSPVANASVEIWQCDAAGHYSQYSQPGYDGRAQTCLRGIQTTDSAGRVTFTTVYPGWYAGRATHIHVEVTINGRSVKVTQIAFPEAVNAQVYSTAAYASRGNNPTSNASDMVFADSLSSELAVMTGDTTTGFTGTYTVGVAL